MILRKKKEYKVNYLTICCKIQEINKIILKLNTEKITDEVEDKEISIKVSFCASEMLATKTDGLG